MLAIYFDHKRGKENQKMPEKVNQSMDHYSSMFMRVNCINSH